MNKTQEQLEIELMGHLADTLCLAVEELDAQTIVRCLRAVLEEDVSHHADRLEKYKTLLDSIRPVT
jgi:hypothetical protein